MITIAILRAAGLTDAQIARVAEIEERERLLARREQNRQASRRYHERKVQQKQRPSQQSSDFNDETDEMKKAVAVGEPPKAKLFREGRVILTSFGVGERQMGGLIGRWLKMQADPEKVLEAMEVARSKNVSEPVSYVTTVLNTGGVNGKRRNGTATLVELSQQLADEARELERKAGISRSTEPF